MKKILSVLFIAILLPVLQAGCFGSLYLGETQAVLESVSNKYTKINFGTEIKAPPSVSTYPLDGKFIVRARIRDDSALAGYKNNVWQTLDRFDFNSWAWIAGGTGNSQTGNDTMRGKYDTYTFWDIYPTQPSPVTRYKVTLSADTKTIPRKTESMVFYVARTAPAGTRTPAQRTAAANWIAGRLERAAMYKDLANTVRARRTSSTTINYKLEMGKIIGSAAGLFGPTDIQSYGAETGLNFLELASNVFGNLASSTLVSAGGAIYQAYDWGKWAKSTLQASADLWDATITGFAAQQTMNQAGTSLETSLDDLAAAMRDEANEAIRIIYTSPYASSSTWLSLLSTEKTRANSAGVAAASAKSKAKAIAGENSETYNFFRIINELANSDWVVLNAARP